MNDDLDPLDETLAHGLRALAPSEFELDTDRALGTMRPALHRARARRRVAVSTTALGVLAVAVVGVAALRPSPASKLNIRGHSRPTVSTPFPPSTTRAPVTTTQPRHTPVTSPRNQTPSTRPDHQPSDSGPLTTVTTPNPTKTTTPPNGGETTTTIAAPATKTYASIGGHATIRFAAGRLTLVSYGPATGYTPDVRKNDATEIEVRFSNGSREFRIRVRVQDGRLRPEITEN